MNGVVKFYTLITLLALGSIPVLHAQTNTGVSATTTNQTVITSDQGTFDARQAIYSGHVRVEDPQMNLSCEMLVADLPQSGQINHIVAETDVVIDFTDPKGQKMHATSDMAVYDFKIENDRTNDTVTFTGNAKIETEQGWLTGEPIVLDRATGHLTATNQKMILRQNLSGTLMPTNSPAKMAATNGPPVPK
jgi:lipopolysaccharide transport protein LptA